MSTDKNTKHMEKLYIGPNLPFVLGVGMESIWWSNSEDADFADELLHCTDSDDRVEAGEQIIA